MAQRPQNPLVYADDVVKIVETGISGFVLRVGWASDDESSDDEEAQVKFIIARKYIDSIAWV